MCDFPLDAMFALSGTSSVMKICAAVITNLGQNYKLCGNGGKTILF